MRLIAKQAFDYHGTAISEYQIFDMLEREGLDLINRGLARAYNLEDPTQKSDAVALYPGRPPLPDVPPVEVDPDSATAPAASWTGTFQVTMTGEGQSASWMPEKEADADWLTVDSPTEPQSIDGPVTYTVDDNATGSERTGHIYVNGKTFTLTQIAGVTEKHHGKRR